MATDPRDMQLSVEAIRATVEKLKKKNNARQDALDAMKTYTQAVDYGASVKIADSLYGPGTVMRSEASPYYEYWSNVTGVGTQLVFGSQPTEETLAQDRKLQLKMFVHFARLFCEKYSGWQLLPEPDDPFNKVKLVRPDTGVSITSLYPMNELAIYGAPDVWATPRKELGQVLPIVKIAPHTFFGWALDVDVPEWVR